MIARIVEGSGSKRRVTNLTLDKQVREGVAIGFCNYVGIKAPVKKRS